MSEGMPSSGGTPHRHVEEYLAQKCPWDSIVQPAYSGAGGSSASGGVYTKNVPTATVSSGRTRGNWLDARTR
jgi:hypothetical protein